MANVVLPRPLAPRNQTQPPLRTVTFTTSVLPKGHLGPNRRAVNVTRIGGDEDGDGDDNGSFVSIVANLNDDFDSTLVTIVAVCQKILIIVTEISFMSLYDVTHICQTQVRRFARRMNVTGLVSLKQYKSSVQIGT
jgi:hypothetical protein